MPLQLTRQQQQLLRESMRRERPARSARTALRPLPLPRRGRKRRGISGSRTVTTAEAEGGALSSQIKTDECTAWAFLPKILHDQCLRIAHLSVTSSVSAAACSSLRPCDPPARTPTPRRIRLS